MGLVAVVLVGGFVVGLLAGGSPTRLAALPLRDRWLVAGAAVAQAGGALLGVLGVTDAAPAYVAGLALSAALVAAFLARNRFVPGVPLVAVGLTLNAVVVAANGAMPVSLWAAARAGVSTAPIASGSDARHRVADTATRLSVLGDVVPVPLPLRPEVVSPGDTLIAAGLALLVVAGMRRGGQRPGLRPATAGAAGGPAH